MTDRNTNTISTTGRCAIADSVKVCVAAGVIVRGVGDAVGGVGNGVGNGVVDSDGNW